MITRRQSLKHLLAASTTMSLLPSFSLAQVTQSHYALTASLANHQLGPNDAPSTPCWLYNETSPGPLITAMKGDNLKVEFINQLPEPTTIHWHGIRIDNAMDGVAGVTQPPIPSGGSFTYSFTVKDSGSFWYHSHNKSWEQVARGLYGGLVVKDSPDELGSDDLFLIADDWRLDENFAIHEDSFGALHDAAHAGRFGNWLTINGKSQPDITVPSHRYLRLRLCNTANARPLHFAFSDWQTMQVVALDGALCQPFEVTNIRLAPAQRADLLIKINDRPLTLNEVSHPDGLVVARLIPEPSLNTAPPKVSLPLNPQPWYSLPQLDEARIIPIHMQGGAMGNLGGAMHGGRMHSLRELASEQGKIWAFNGIVGGPHERLAELSQGEVVVLRIWNDSRWEHAMHLHGHHFWVASREFGHSPRAVLRDTYLMAPDERADLIFIADNPGKWLFHCHMMEHHAAGMVGVIEVT